MIIRSKIIYLVILALLIRGLLTGADSYLNEWDERYHALVAKNMMDEPFKPMMRTDPVLEYDYKSWCCNHIWLHKQPLFLWQMALSLKVLGVNEIALRFPSALMGSIAVLFIFQIALFWTKDKQISFLSAFLAVFAFYQLELTSGRMTCDHNDVAFSFYMTASIWAFIRYLKSNNSWKWAIMIGLFAGAAILNKWLTGLLIFGGWGLYVLLDYNTRKDILHYLKILFAFLVCCIVFLPWQIYILNAFPLESAFEFSFNSEHISEAVEGHGGTIFFHLEKLPYLYGF